MKESEAWLKVAKSVHYWAVERRSARWLYAPGLCYAVTGLVPPSMRYKMLDRMDEVYKPDVPSGLVFWWGIPSSNERDDNARVLAALFLREIALDKERKKQ